MHGQTKTTLFTIAKLKVKSLFHVTLVKILCISNESFGKPSKRQMKGFPTATTQTAVISFFNVTWKNMKRLGFNTNLCLQGAKTTQ